MQSQTSSSTTTNTQATRVRVGNTEMNTTPFMYRGQTTVTLSGLNAATVKNPSQKDPKK